MSKATRLARTSPPLAPLPLVRSRSCRALSACLLHAFSRLRALVLRSLSALRVSVSARVFAPFTPSHALPRNAPLQRVSLQLPCVLLLLPRLSVLSRVAECCYSALSHRILLRHI